MRKLQASFNSLILVLTLLSLVACSDVQKLQIHQLLDDRDTAVSERNIEAFTQLVSSHYRSGRINRSDVLLEMQALFAHFEKIQMQSQDRHIVVSDDSRAECVQTYVLKVFADNKWRKLVQRETLILSKEEDGWKIISGL